MKHIAIVLLAFWAFCTLSAQEHEFSAQSCTSIMVGRLASTDGSVITSHTCDGRYRTWAWIEPAADHPKGAMHEVLRGTMKTAFRGDTTGVKLMGTIPEARHTYAYLNTAYPALNEKQLAIGETTFGGPDTLVNPKGLFTIEELERVALQRCTTAREAIKLMGELAQKYGYGDSGECLTLADPKEVWQFEILGCGKDEIGAVWAARRIPDDHVGVSANIPRIGSINRKDKNYCMASDNVEAVARKFGLWDGKGEFVFWRAYNCDYAKGRNFHDREFFILNALAPSLGLTYDMDELPFSVKPDDKVDVREVMELFRATYEGSDFDMCKNVIIERPAKGEEPARKEISPVANPWLTTTMRNTLNTIAPGTVEFRRTVAVAWCAYSHVTQLRSWLPDAVGGICWLSVDNPAQSPRIPVFCGTSKLPEAFLKCGQNKWDEDAVVWKFRPANKLATLAWQSTKKGFMENVLAIEDTAFEGLPDLESAPATALDGYTAAIFNQAAALWKDMEHAYWVKFGTGF
ncbi:MAG: C69 family dipeptidase [Bacteroidales bacterium]|nr:C69 family dipeptidase [Bacteroidales bacterium]